MPVYNGIEFMNESVSSVFSQEDYKKWELIIAINGYSSNSDTYNLACHIVSNLRPKFKNGHLFQVKILDLDTKGKTQTLNKMIKYHLDEKTNWIAILDVDDIWHPMKLKMQYPLLKTGLYGVVGSQCVYFGDKNGSPNIPYGDLTNVDFLETNPIINSSAIIKRNYAYWIEEWEGIDDYALWLFLKYKKVRFYNLPNILIKHRLHSTSAFNTKNIDDKLEKIKNKYRGVLPFDKFNNLKKMYLK
jgi:hypothetical protein